MELLVFNNNNNKNNNNNNNNNKHNMYLCQTLLYFLSQKKMPVMRISYSLKICVQVNVSGQVLGSCSKRRNTYLRSGIVINIWCVFFIYRITLEGEEF